MGGALNLLLKRSGDKAGAELAAAADRKGAAV
jgi:hypothetical protein